MRINANIISNYRQIKFSTIYSIVFILKMSTLFSWPYVQANPWLNYIMHPMAMFVLCGYFLIHIPKPLDVKDFVFGMGIFWAFIGDLISIFPGETAYLIVITAFLFFQLCILYALHKERSGWLKKRPAVILFFVFYGFMLMTVLWQGLEELRIFAVIYTAIVLAAGIAALNRKGNVTEKSYAWVMMGCILFILSDSLFAIHTYSQPLPYGDVSMKSIYMIGQYMLVIGYIDEQVNKK